MTARADITELRYGRLIAKRLHHTSKGRAYWECVCDCGNSVVVSLSNLRKKGGHTKSCGCLAKEAQILSGKATLKHGIAKDYPKFYSIWNTMRNRCENPQHASYKNYGAKGVRVCQDWHTIEGFAKDMLDSYLSAVANGFGKVSIERVDTSGDYSKSNCKWIPLKDQSYNKGIPKNNKSGIVGVCFYMDKWVAYFSNPITGKCVRKSFSVSKYGDDALTMAIKFREDGIDYLRSLGVPYSENHGKESNQNTLMNVS